MIGSAVYKPFEPTGSTQSPFLRFKELEMKKKVLEADTVIFHYAIREAEVSRKALKSRNKDKKKQKVKSECCQHLNLGLWLFLRATLLLFTLFLKCII